MRCHTAAATRSTRASSPSSRGAVFNGKIIVRPDAQKTDAKQTNKALLLSDDATINTKPELEIFANDVKCTHGAAIGQLDEGAMFYLRSRGLGVAESRAMLVRAFAGDILNSRQDRSCSRNTWKRASRPGCLMSTKPPRRHGVRRSESPTRLPYPEQAVHGKPLVYLDNAATTQKPQAVIDAMVRSYAEDNANIHRGVHLLSERATQAYEQAREKVQKFLNAPDLREIIFVRGTTEAINLVAQTFGRSGVNGRGTRCSSPRWSTTRTSCPGRFSARRSARISKCSRSPTRASSGWICSTGC